MATLIGKAYLAGRKAVQAIDADQNDRDYPKQRDSGLHTESTPPSRPPRSASGCCCGRNQPDGALAPEYRACAEAIDQPHQEVDGASVSQIAWRRTQEVISDDPVIASACALAVAWFFIDGTRAFYRLIRLDLVPVLVLVANASL